ncbi:GPI mannosyltransferase 1 [Exaiptasia diaphana]|nr:GPI mannosyltransferase 1 [Exaiptasia diaphana]
MLIFYGEWQPPHMLVKYTDIDYHVFTDAATYVHNGGSPYERETYRYTPLLAVILTPNIYLHAAFGKVLFILFDVLTGYLLYRIQIERGFEQTTAVYSACLWLFNPVAAVVSSRGNAESIMAFLVLATLYAALKNKPLLAALLLALAVHFKIFPIMYSLPLFLFIDKTRDTKFIRGNAKECVMRLTEYILSPSRIKLVFGFIITIAPPPLVLYRSYGFEFLEHTYLYHVTRTDPKHNFSAYFYMLYLTQDSAWSKLIGLLSFIPQLTLTVGFAFRHYKDVCFCCFIQTFAFVTFNKVCTSQYFLWYPPLLPLVVPQIAISLMKAILMIVAWFASQAVWLYFAYYLEFEGLNTFLNIWISSLVFLFVNLWILVEVLKNYIGMKSLKIKAS